MKNPYESLGEKSFWKTAVANKSMYDISELWDPKFKIGKEQKVVTFGSCFAQHIGKALKKRDFKWLSTETPPWGLSEASESLITTSSPPELGIFIRQRCSSSGPIGHWMQSQSQMRYGRKTDAFSIRSDPLSSQMALPQHRRHSNPYARR